MQEDLEVCGESLADYREDATENQNKSEEEEEEEEEEEKIELQESMRTVKDKKIDLQESMELDIKMDLQENMDMDMEESMEMDRKIDLQESMESDNDDVLCTQEVEDVRLEIKSHRELQQLPSNNSSALTILPSSESPSNRSGNTRQLILFFEDVKVKGLLTQTPKLTKDHDGVSVNLSTWEDATENQNKSEQQHATNQGFTIINSLSYELINLSTYQFINLSTH